MLMMHGSELWMACLRRSSIQPAKRRALAVLFSEYSTFRKFGTAIAEKIMSNTTPATEYFDALPDPEKLPPEPFATLGANAIFRWNEWKAGKEK